MVESLLAGDDAFAKTWQELPQDAQLAAWARIDVRALELLASLTLQQLAQAQAASGRPDVGDWVHRAIDAARLTELNADVLTQAYLASYRDRGVQVGAEHPDPDDPMAVGARLAVLGAGLLAGELDGDSVRVRQLVKASAGPEEVRGALVQLADALAIDLASHTGASKETVFRALVSVDPD